MKSAGCRVAIHKLTIEITLPDTVWVPDSDTELEALVEEIDAVVTVYDELLAPLQAALRRRVHPEITIHIADGGD